MLIWEDNNKLREELAKYKKPTVRDLKVDVPNGFQAEVRMHIPSDFDEHDKEKKYPMIVGVYAGPAFKKIVDVYTLGKITLQLAIFCNFLRIIIYDNLYFKEGIILQKELIFFLGI